MAGSINNNDVYSYEFEELFNRYWKQVYMLCLRYTNDDAVAKDLTQNIFLSLWERKMSFQTKEDIVKYLSKSAKYQVLIFIRNNKHKKNWTYFPELQSMAYNPENVIVTKEEAVFLKKYIESLTEPTKTMYRLSREERLSYQEIAKMMGVTVKTVEYHISKALRHLRNKFSV